MSYKPQSEYSEPLLHRGKRNCCILGVLSELLTSHFSPRSSLPDFVKEQRLGRSSHFISTLQHKFMEGWGGEKRYMKENTHTSVVQSEIIKIHFLMSTTLVFSPTHANFFTRKGRVGHPPLGQLSSSF